MFYGARIKGSLEVWPLCAFVMSKKMKLLIGYDGSESADISLVELARAGLAQNVEALILIDDVWLPSSPSEYSRAVKREPEHGFMPLTRDKLNSSRVGAG